MMDQLPKDAVFEILKKLTENERNCFALVCKRFQILENHQRHTIRFGYGVLATPEVLLYFSQRFPNVSKLEIAYLGLEAEQIDDQGLLVLSKDCKNLTDLTLFNCSSITNIGFGHLPFAKELSSLRLDYVSEVTGHGLSAVALGCQKLKSFYVNYCKRVVGAKWLEYFGMFGNLEELYIKNMKGIGEQDLVQLGNGWRKLRSFWFETEANHRNKIYKRLGMVPSGRQMVPCDNMVELSLVNSVVDSDMYVPILRMCNMKLEKLHLEMCLGVSDSDIVLLVEKAKNLRSISIRVPSILRQPLEEYISLRLAGETLKAIAQHCSKLETFKISFSDGEVASPLSRTLEGLITLVKICPIRELYLDHVSSFDNSGMEALRSAKNLEILEIVQCNNVTDHGLIMVSQIPSLNVLILSKCSGITNNGFGALVGTNKLEVLVVKECPHVSRIGVHAAAKSVSFK